MERSTFLSSIMHDVGLPLIRAIIKYGPNQNEDAIAAEMATLLTQTVQSNDYIKDTLDIKELATQNSELHLILTSLSSKIIAAHYERTKTPPTDQDLKRFMGAINALLAFSEDYMPIISLTEAYPENKQTPSVSPRHTTDLTYISVFLPLINAVARFSFGLNETRMIQNVSERLNARTAQIRSNLLGDTLNDTDKKSAELSILGTLVDLYASCHMQEIDRITTLSSTAPDTQDSTQQIENIWMLFEHRVSLLFGLARDASLTDISANFTALFEEAEALDDIEAPEEEEEEEYTPMTFYKKK
ncbi:MAG: hypothetical protein COB36_07115 [Alphaproteobacteria bacterium]|nr:MAG: hypothetical protein COB36_07115 [Alphaproteobacteria bacterium]